MTITACASPSEQPVPVQSAFDILAEELGAVAGQIERESNLRLAAAIADMRRIDAERELRLSALERQVADRIAAVRDGAEGREGEPGEPGSDGQDGSPGEPGAAGRDGQDADMDLVALMVGEHVDRAVSAIPAPEKGEKGDPGQDADAEAIKRLIGEEVAVTVGLIPPAEKGESGKDGADGRDGRDVQDIDVTQDGAVVEFGFTVGDTRSLFELELPAGPAGPPGADGNDGERGAEGAAGKLGAVAEWKDSVHYEGDVVAHVGGSWQAIRDTAKEPPHGDWRMIASAGRDGRDGRSFAIKGTWSEVEDYLSLDVVMLNGASFVARHDAPGICPGEGWQLLSMQGKRGKDGPPGPRGETGPQGPAIAAAEINDEGLFTLVNTDGTLVICDFYPLLSRLGRAG